MAKDDVIEVEDVVDGDVVRGRNNELVDVASGEDDIFVLEFSDDEVLLASEAEGLKMAGESFGRNFFDLEGIDDDDSTFRDFLAQHAAKGEVVSFLILRKFVILIAVGSEDGSAANPDRRLDVAGTGATSSFLSPGLFIGAVDFVTFLGFRGGLAKIRSIDRDRVFDDLRIDVGDAEDVSGDFNLASIFTIQGFDG